MEKTVIAGLLEEYKLYDLNLKTYSAKEIMAAGGIDAFSVLIGNDREIKVPKIEFSDAEWDEMLKDGI